MLDEASPARLAPTNFHLPPGTNADFQKVATGQVAPHALGLLLWGPQGSALNGVGIAPRDLTRFPKYTGGLLMQDTNRDCELDPAAGGGGQPDPGLLVIQFKAGSLPGPYRPTVELIGGNSYRFTIEAVAP